MISYSPHLLILVVTLGCWLIGQTLFVFHLPVDNYSTVSEQFVRLPTFVDKDILSNYHAERVHSSQGHQAALFNQAATQMNSKHTDPAVTSDRVAVIVPYTGKSLPVWFNTFLFYAQFGSALVDWFIFVTNENFSGMVTPPNIHVIYIPLSQFYDRMLSVDSRYITSSNASKLNWRNNFAKCVTKYPYLIVEFKPCLGFIFQDYLTGYSHWGSADVDILLGRSQTFLTPQILRSFDVYTSSFGDVSRMYLRGQFAVFRKTHQLLHLWRKCSYFEHLTDRIAAALTKQADGTVRGWRFESAEGCISSAAFLGQTNISTFVASSQISDVFRAPMRDKEAFFLGNTLMRCYEEPVLSVVAGGG
jgi:hypothetical protein